LLAFFSLLWYRRKFAVKVSNNSMRVAARQLFLKSSQLFIFCPHASHPVASTVPKSGSPPGVCIDYINRTLASIATKINFSKVISLPAVPIADSGNRT
jgi:hypothetical protein